MHGTALAFAIASFFAEKFGHHFLRVRPFGNTMTVSAMGSGNKITGTQRLAGAYCGCFLADAGMNVAGHASLQEQIRRHGIKRAHFKHFPIEGKQLLFRILFRSHVQTSNGSGLNWTKPVSSSKRRIIFTPPIS